MVKKEAVVVDDCGVSRGLMVNFLERLNFKTHVFSGAIEALDFLWTKNKKNIQLIVTDIMMEGMSGIEFMEEIREHSPGIMIICISATPDIGEVCLKKGCDVFIPKPLSFKNVEEAISGR